MNSILWVLKSRKSVFITTVILLLTIIFINIIPNKLFSTPTSYIIIDKNGSLLNACIATDGQWRFPYHDDVPNKFERCILQFEDKRFYYHFGIDILALVRATKQNLGKKKTVSGGSTITMQLARLSMQHSKRSIWNKLLEAIVAIRIECGYRKHSILALYACNAPFGSNVVGLDAAAWRYFGRDANSLSWGEMAALAVLPNAPSLVHLGKNRMVLLKKRNALLDKLSNKHIIDITTASLAKIEPLPGEPKPLPQFAPHLLDRVKRDFVSNGNKTGVKTTIDLTIQQQVSNIIAQHHDILKGNQINNAASIVVEVETGNVLAYIGNVYEPNNASAESNVDILSSVRSPGSTLKPLLYAALLSEGLMLPRQLIPDIPTQIGGYTPQNFDLGYDGAVPANHALSRSLNIPAIKMLQQYKYQRFYDVLKQCGISTLTKPADYYGMSLILGGCEISPFELAGVYSSMARMYNHQQQNKGKWNNKDWFFPKYSFDNTIGEKTKKAATGTNLQSIFNYTAIWHTLNAMNEVMRPGEEGLWNLFSSSQRIAWKTGTSFGFRDGWAVGITPKYCVLVWVGNTTGVGRPDLTGINTAGPILFDIFRMLPKSAWFQSPTSDFDYIATCRKSGYKASLDCGDIDTIMVSLSAKDAPICPYCRKSNMDKTGIFRVNESCENQSDMKHISWFVLPPKIEYYYQPKHPDYLPLPSFKTGCTIENSHSLDIIYPEESAQIYIPIEANGRKGNTIFTATHRNGSAKLFWHLDNLFIGTTSRFHQMALNPTVGKHVLTIIDESGNRVHRNFVILEK